MSAGPQSISGMIGAVSAPGSAPVPQQRAPDLEGTIAVVIPCFNDGETLSDAVSSARAQERIDELVVVDDGSTDPDTLALFVSLQAEGVRVVHRPNGGLGAARMSGVDATSSDYVFCLDADDRLLPGSLAALASALDSDPELALAWGDYRLFGERSWRQQTAPSLDPWQIAYQNDLPASLMIRRGELLAAGGWQLRGGYEDWDLLMSLAERGARGARLAIVAYEYRQHGVRMLAESATRHADIYALLQQRHPRLFSERRRAWRRSNAPWALKLALPLIFALPIAPNRRRLLAGAVCHLARGRGVAQLARRIRTGG
jgi:glycosyltransferase involved in cell wall biosynthesis